MPRRSTIRGLYTSVVQVVRLGSGNGAGIQDGAFVANWVVSDDVIDEYYGVPGFMKCKIDIQFVRPGINAPQPAEAGTVIPRAGTIFYDLPAHESYVRAGDHLRVTGGTAYVGSTWEITAIPEAAQDYRGPIHMEAQIVEKAISTEMRWPGQEPGEIYR